MEFCDPTIVPREHCSFCRELGCPPEQSRYFHVLAGKPERKLLLRTAHFVVIPGIGQLVPGYLLIRPTEHFISCGHMPAPLFDELEELKLELRSLLRSVYGTPTLFFEHGALTERMRGSCCTDHAHVHVMPTDLDITAEVVNALAARRVEGFRALPELIQNATPYVAFENAEGHVYAGNATGAPKQLVRRIIARRLGREDWDWKAFVDEAGFITEAAVRDTVDRLAVTV
jgi:diadenosine tetraphosphate (Ap4A) HIT family hydrolase